jgi:hypothetical protein
VVRDLDRFEPTGGMLVPGAPDEAPSIGKASFLKVDVTI